MSGRPKKQLDLPDGWQETVLAEYGSGASDVEIKCTLRKMRGSLSNDLWDRWLRDEPVFSETIKEGRELSHNWWMKLGRAGAAGKVPVNPTLWIFNMKNRFGWVDKHETTSTVTVSNAAENLTDEQLYGIATAGSTGVAKTKKRTEDASSVH